MKESGFSRQLKLCQAAEFQTVFKSGKRTGNNHFQIIVVDNSLGYPRLGLAISKRILKWSHDRNRIKRIVRESFRKSQVNLNSYDVVVVARNACNNSNNKNVSNAIQKLFDSTASENFVHNLKK